MRSACQALRVKKCYGRIDNDDRGCYALRGDENHYRVLNWITHQNAHAVQRCELTQSSRKIAKGIK
jgi:hypothetical protein